MASFAALVSLKTIIHTLKNDHPNPPISLDNQQVNSLLQNITFLQEFLELYSHHELYSAQELDSLIKRAAYAAEDVIESHIVDRIGGSTSKVESSSNGECFYQDLKQVVEEMDRIKRKAMEIKEKLGDEDHESGSWTFDASPAAAAVRSLKQQGILVGFEDVLEDLVFKLTRNTHSSRQIIPIVGMGGIGKTTLVLKAFEHTAYHFDIRVWVTISQKFKTRDVLIEILCQRCQFSKETLREVSEDELRKRIHEELFNRRYLVVLDDMWSIDAWDEIKWCFPDNESGSAMIVTTRLSDLALQLTNSSGIIQLKLLDEEKSWDLFCKMVFGEDDSPKELKEIGRKIVESCRGLPLSVVVIGGLLAKSKKTEQEWEDVAGNISSTVNSEDNERCLKILYLSYRNLPIHLKPCFLFMGVFREDASIQVSWLVKILVAEGFLKPIDGMAMEDVVKIYINDLVERNLIRVHKWGSTGKVKSFKIHDLLRDLCIREAQKDNFFCDVKKFYHHSEDHDCPEAQWYVGNNLAYKSGLDAPQRIVLRGRVVKDDYLHHQVYTLESASLVRSIIVSDFQGIPDSNLKLLRVLTGDGESFPAIEDDSCMHFYNAKYLALRISKTVKLLHFSSIAHCWNLQTLIVHEVRNDVSKSVTIPIEIWKLPQLRHIYFVRSSLKPPSTLDDEDFVLQNLTSLSRVDDFKCSEVVKRIPNIKKVKLWYHTYECINLEKLHKLEHLMLYLDSPAAIGGARRREASLHSLGFPHSLKILGFCSFQGHNWDVVNTMMGALPNLEKLVMESIVGTEWILTDDEEEQRFPSLKVLKLYSCYDLESWIIDGAHFPLLKHLTLCNVPNLTEIPSDIPNIESIHVKWCSDSLVSSAKSIVEEQEDLGNLNLKVSVKLFSRSKHLESLASSNFKIEVE